MLWKNIISKSSMFSNEVHVITLSLECMKEICNNLSYDHQKINLKFISTGDSAIASYLFNPIHSLGIFINAKPCSLTYPFNIVRVSFS